MPRCGRAAFGAPGKPRPSLLCPPVQEFPTAEQFGQLFNRRWNKRGLRTRFRFHAGRETRFDQTFRAKAQGNIRSERLLTAWANAFVFPCRLQPILRKNGRKVTGAPQLNQKLKIHEEINGQNPQNQPARQTGGGVPRPHSRFPQSSGRFPFAASSDSAGAAGARPL